MPSQPLHEDFGEKIGGAKKDLWSARGLYSADLDDMNEREADKYVRKDNVWKKPDYQAMLDDAVPASPRYYRAYNYEEKSYQQKRYIDTVRQLQKVMEKVRTVEDAKNAFVDFYIRNAYLRSVREWDGRTAYERTSDYSHNPALTDNLRNVIKISSDVQFEYDFVRKAKSEQFLVPKEQKVPRGYDIRRKIPTTSQKVITFYRQILRRGIKRSAGCRNTPKAVLKAANSVLYLRSWSISPERDRISETVRKLPDSIILTPSAFAAASLATG